MNYDDFHKSPTVQRKLIDQKNFTYRKILQIIDTIPKSDKKNVLDYGCGVGTIDFYLASKGWQVIGMEISKKAIEICKKSAKTIGVEKNCKFYSDKFVPDKKYDLIICSEVIEHVNDDDGLLGKLVGFLKKGGYIFISTPSINAPLYKLKLLNKFDKNVGHLRRYVPSDLIKKVQKLNLKIIKFEKFEGILRNSLFVFPELGWVIRFLKGPLSDFVTLIDGFMVKLFGESNLIIFAKKI